MLIIRKEQIAVLKSIPLRDFEASLIRHFTRFYPQDCAWLGERQIRKLIQLSIERAAGHGYCSRQEVGYYCNLMLMLGCDFDRDPQIPWAGEGADAWTIAAPLERIQSLFEATLSYLRNAFGESGGYMARALVRLRDYDLKTAPQISSPQFEGDILNLFEFFCPQKFSVQGEEPTRALIRRGIQDAARYGLSSGQGVTVYGALMFMVGAGFDHDPVYPWAEPILNDASLTDEREKVDLLHRASMAYIEQVLAD